MSELNEQFGRYRLVRRIATGGMGELFLARYLNASGIDRFAVVKRILPHLTSDPDFISYFLNEGRITSLLSHPNIIQTLELGRTQDQYYIAMEYIPGVTLVRLLATSMIMQRRFSIPLIFHLSMQIASALEYIHNLKNIEGHKLNIIHLDLAPHNILVTPDGLVKLLDFGISRAQGLPSPLASAGISEDVLLTLRPNSLMGFQWTAESTFSQWASSCTKWCSAVPCSALKQITKQSRGSSMHQFQD